MAAAADQLDESFIVNRTEVSYLLGVSERQVSRMTEQGMRQVKRGRWHLRDVFAFVKENAAAVGEGPTSDGLPLADAKRDLIVAQTAKVELERQRLAGELMPYSEHLHVCTELAAIFVSTLESLPAQAGPMLAGLDTLAAIEYQLEEATKHARHATVAKLEAARDDYRPANPGGESAAD